MNYNFFTSTDLQSISKSSWLQKNLEIARIYAEDTIVFLEKREFPNKKPFYGYPKIEKAFNSTIESIHVGDLCTKEALKRFKFFRDEINKALSLI